VETFSKYMDGLLNGHSLMQLPHTCDGRDCCPKSCPIISLSKASWGRMTYVATARRPEYAAALARHLATPIDDDAGNMAKSDDVAITVSRQLVL